MRFEVYSATYSGYRKPLNPPSFRVLLAFVGKEDTEKVEEKRKKTVKFVILTFNI